MAFYKMQELSGIGPDGQRTTYPRMTGGRVVTTDELAARVSEESTFSAGEVKGILASVCKYLAWYMRDGDRVKVDGLGTFSASLGMADDAEPEVPGVTRRNARSVRVRGVNLRADKQLVYEMNRGLRLERSPYKPGRSSARYTPEERLALALEHLGTHPYLTVRDYRALTGLCATPAREELRRWASTPGSGLRTSGTGSHRVYVKG